MHTQQAVILLSTFELYKKSVSKKWMAVVLYNSFWATLNADYYLHIICVTFFTYMDIYFNVYIVKNIQYTQNYNVNANFFCVRFVV